MSVEMLGFIACVEMKWKLTEKRILYFHIFENSNNVTVYLTDACEFLISTLSLEELKNTFKKLDINNETKILRVLKNNIKVENLHYDEKESVLKLSLHNECKSCDLVFKFSSVDKPEEKEKHLKALLFSLARIAQEKSSQLGPDMMEQVTSLTTLGPTISMRSSKFSPKRPGAPMSIVNPGSKRIRQKSTKIKYEEENDSDS